MKALQQGLTTLVFCLLLLLASSWLTLTMLHQTLAKQRMLTADYHNQAGMAAAEAGLAFGISWLNTNTPQWTWLDADSEVAQPAALPGLPGNPLPFQLVIEYRRHPATPGLIHIRAAAFNGQQSYYAAESLLMADGKAVRLAGSWHDFE